MKKLLLALWLSAGITGFSYAQISLVPAEMAKHLPDESAVVRDSDGARYRYDDWTYLMSTGKFNLRSNGKKNPNDKYPEFLIYPLYAESGQRVITEEMKRNKPEESEQFKTGDAFNPFNEKDIKGERFDLKKMTGKVFVINFWFIGCPPCREEMPDLNYIAAHYKDNKDVVFIAICLDKGYNIKSFIKTNPFNYHIIDDGQVIADKYGVHLYPTNLVVNKKGKIVFSSVSNQPANQYWITKTIDEALAPVNTVAN